MFPDHLNPRFWFLPVAWQQGEIRDCMLAVDKGDPHLPREMVGGLPVILLTSS